MRHVFPQRFFASGLATLVLVACLSAGGARAQDGADTPPAPNPPAEAPEAEPEKTGPPGIGDPFPTHLPIVPPAGEGAKEPAKPTPSDGETVDGPPPAEGGDVEEPSDGAGESAGEGSPSDGGSESEPQSGQALSELVGETPRPLVLVFWSVKCVVCERYGEVLAKLTETIGDSAALVVVVSGSDQAPDAVRKALADAGLVVTVYLDPEGAAAERLGVRVTPTAFVVGADNVLRYRGPIDDDRRARRRDARALLLPAVQAVAAGREVDSADVPPFGSAVR